MLGYNYRMDELRAAMGIVQLACLPQWNARRRELTNFYRDCLAEHVPEVTIPFEQTHETAAHLMPILLPGKVNRESIMARLREDGIQSSIHYPPSHQFTYYREIFPDVVLPNTEEFCSRELTLPLHPALREDDVEKVVRSLRTAIYDP